MYLPLGRLLGKRLRRLLGEDLGDDSRGGRVSLYLYSSHIGHSSSRVWGRCSVVRGVAVLYWLALACGVVLRLVGGGGGDL